MLTFSTRLLRQLALPALALALACSDDPPVTSVVVPATPVVCVDDTLRAPLLPVACADLEEYFHTAGVVKTFGESYDVVASGTIAYVCDGLAGLVIIDMHDPSRPTIASELPITGRTRGAAVCGDLVFVAADNGGLVVVDASDPVSPRVLSQYYSPGSALAVVHRDQKVFLADDVIGLMIIDVADPLKPKPLGIENTPGRANGVAIIGSVAYVSDRLLGMRIVSISDPENPWLIAQVAVAGQPGAIAVENNVAFVAAGTEGLVVIDVTKPENAKVITTYDTPGTVLDVAVEHGIAYLADGANGLLILDVTTPGLPKLIARSGAENVARGVSVMGTWVLAADSKAGFRVLDAASVLSPPVASSYEVPTGLRIEALALTPDDLAYSITSSGIVLVVRRDSADNLTLEGNLQIGGTPYHADYYEGFVYVANGNGIVIIDPTSPSQPQIVATLPASGAQRFAVFDSTVFITRGFSETALLDLGTGLSTGLGFSAGSVSANATNGYFVQLSGRLYITAGKVAEPRPLRNIIEGFGSTRDIHARGDFLFIAKHQGGTDSGTGIERSAGIEVFDLTLPEIPRPVTYIETSIAVERIAFDGDLMYVTGRDQGLEVFDVSDITAPRIVGTFAPGSDVYDVAMFDGRIFIAAGSGGLLLLNANCSR